MKKKRQIVKIIEDICNEKKYNLQKFSDDWIMQIKNKQKNCFIIGYRFPNNDSAIAKICDDKSALASVLEANNIACVPHLYFENPCSTMYDNDGMYSQLFSLLNKYGELVCKANTGSGGNAVYLVKSKKELEMNINKIFNATRAMAVSPKINIKNEYRVIIENNRAHLIYSKQRPYVVGDGLSSIHELCASLKIDKEDKIKSLDYDQIPANGEKITVAWKHNLGQGSTPELVNDEAKIFDLTKFALHTANALNINFASIDIIQDENDTYKILEINSGVMMESFSKQNKDNYNTAKHIYESAIADYFNEDKQTTTTYNIYEEISDKINKELDY